MIVLQKPTKSFTTLNVASGMADFVPRFDELVTQSLVISFSMKMEKELTHSLSQRLLAKEDHSI